MAPSRRRPGIVAGRLPSEALAANFADLAPPLTAHEASVAADRCYFCYDAPCIVACPTSIDIPLFIRADRRRACPRPRRGRSSRQNILGGMCARVCPTETLCEEACVREARRGPAGRDRPPPALRHRRADGASGPALRARGSDGQAVSRSSAPARPGSPARTASPCSATRSLLMDARPKGGGLNEFGIAAYKAVDGFAQRELDWLLGIGGIAVEYGRAARARRHARRCSREPMTRSSSASASAASTPSPPRVPGAPACGRRSISSPSCARRAISPRCRSGAASSSSAAA